MKKFPVKSHARTTVRKNLAPLGELLAGRPAFASAEDFARLEAALREAQEAAEILRNRLPEAGNGTSDLAASPEGGPAPEQGLLALLDSIQEGAAMVGPGDIILYSNQRFADMLEMLPAEVTGSRITEYMPTAAWLALERSLAAGEEPARHDTALVGHAGPRLSVAVAARQLSTPGGELACLVVTDLTAQKEREEFRLAKESAERSSTAKDDFLAALSHELRTPITPALMAAAALEKDASLPEAARSDIALIRRNIEFEARLIDDLLDLTLITHGKLTLSVEEMNVHAVLNRALQACQGDARQKNLELQIELGATRCAIVGDPVRLQQVFWNVLRNAVKFTPAGGRIAIATGNDQAGNLWIRVTDSGVGFQPELAEHIFQPFQPVNRGMSRAYGGLGLGLAISRSIVTAHGGNLIAESSGPGQGAMFLIELPLEAATQTPAADPAQPPADPTRGIRILLVEDHDDTRACIQQLLESAGHHVGAADSANAALDLAESGTYDLVISDLGLPDLTGHDLMRELHQRYGLGGIALSGYGMEEDVEQSRASGFQHHLTKPVSFDRLKTLVAEFAGKAK